MSWFASLTWSQAALVFAAIAVIAWLTYLVFTSKESLPAPHHSTKRNGVQAVTH